LTGFGLLLTFIWSRSLQSHQHSQGSYLPMVTFCSFDYFFSNLTLWMTVVGIVGLYNNHKSTFFIIKKTLFPTARSTVPPVLARRLSAARHLLFILVIFSLI
jgi:hypothetical protein